MKNNLKVAIVEILMAIVVTTLGGIIFGFDFWFDAIIAIGAIMGSIILIYVGAIALLHMIARPKETAKIVAVSMLMIVLAVIHWWPTEERVESPLVENIIVSYAEDITVEETDFIENWEITPIFDDREVDLISQTIYAESHVCKTTDEKAAIAWCILNRVDAGYGTIEMVVTAPKQFAWTANTDKETYRNLALDVMSRYYKEHLTGVPDGRVLPKEYLYFMGDGKTNYFTTAYHKNSLEFCKSNSWDFSLDSPYI